MNAEGSEPKPIRTPQRRLSGFSFARQWRLTRKELAETLRDRRTIVTLVLMPILVYPLLSIVFRQFLLGSLGRPGAAVFIIAVDDETQQRQIERWLVEGERLLEQQASAGDESRIRVEPPVIEEPRFADVRFAIGDAESELRAGRADLLMRIEGRTRLGVTAKLGYPERAATAAGLRSFVERRIRAVNQALLLPAEQEETLGISLTHEATETPNATRSLLPSIVPLVLLLMTITGAVYPAIDLTAGERERGTLEALVAAPVSRIGLLMAKYAAVLVVALLTATVNLLAMSLTIYGAGLAGTLIGPEQSIVLLAVQVFGLLLLFASFFSAVLLAVTSLAKSFKEAQAYLIPLMMLTLGPGLLSLSPALELTAVMAIVPLVNVVLLAREVFAGTAEVAASLLVIVSTLMYAAVAISVAARIFGSDAILYGSGGSWSELFRRPLQKLTAPSLSAAALCLALVFAATVNVAGAASLLVADASPLVQLLVSAAMMIVAFGLLPLAATGIEHVSIPHAFRLQPPRVIFLVAATMLGLSLGVLVVELISITEQSGLAPIPPQLQELIQQKGTTLQALPLMWVLLTLSIIPAIVEEWFFRGYLFRALELQTGAWATIGITAVAFSLFHVFGPSGVMLVRLLPTLLMALPLGWIAWRSRSVWPGMVLHALNNAILLSLARYRDDLVASGFLSAQSQHLPISWLVAAGITALGGFVLLVWSGRKPPNEAEKEAEQEAIPHASA